MSDVGRQGVVLGIAQRVAQAAADHVRADDARMVLQHRRQVVEVAAVAREAVHADDRARGIGTAPVGIAEAVVAIWPCDLHAADFHGRPRCGCAPRLRSGSASVSQGPIQRQPSSVPSRAAMPERGSYRVLLRSRSARCAARSGSDAVADRAVRGSTGRPSMAAGRCPLGLIAGRPACWRSRALPSAACPEQDLNGIRSMQVFFSTEPAPCPYLAGRLERRLVTALHGDDPDALHDRLLRAGFRRAQGYAYRPGCTGCQACVPVRIPVAQLRVPAHMAPHSARQRRPGGERAPGGCHGGAVRAVSPLRRAPSRGEAGWPR